MTNFIQRLFSKTKKHDTFPRISIGFRLEGIHYETENNSLYIESTRIDGRRLYTDFIDKWKDETTITSLEKEEIFGQVVRFINKKGRTKPIIVINVDYDKEFWEDLCNKHKDQIKEIEYDSNEKKENFQYNMLLDSVRNNGTLIFDDKTIRTEAELIEYWKNRKAK
jgi:hypothetical protein